MACAYLLRNAKSEKDTKIWISWQLINYPMLRDQPNCWFPGRDLWFFAAALRAAGHQSNSRTLPRFSSSWRVYTGVTTRCQFFQVRNCCFGHLGILWTYLLLPDQLYPNPATPLVPDHECRTQKVSGFNREYLAVHAGREVPEVSHRPPIHVTRY